MAHGPSGNSPQPPSETPGPASHHRSVSPNAVVDPAQALHVRMDLDGGPTFSDQQVARYILDVKRVIAVWQQAQGHELTRSRMHQFRRHGAIAGLIEFDDVDLRASAKKTMRKDGGRLLLAAWLEEAKQLEVQRDQAREALSSSATKVARPPLCPSCDGAIGPGGHCRCS